MFRFLTLLLLPALALSKSVSSRNDGLQISASMVDCKNKDDGLMCIKLSNGQFDIVAQFDMTSGEGSIQGQSDSQFYIDLSDDKGVMVFLSSPSVDCGMFTGSMTDGQVTLKCEDGNGSFGSEASRAIPLVERSFKGRSEEEMKLQPRAFDPKGYRVNMVMFYDDAWLKEAGGTEAKAKSEIESMVKMMNQFFKHSTLNVKIQIDVMAIEHAKGQSWTGDSPVPYKDACVELAKKHKIQDANSYFCLGGPPKLHGAGGVAEKGAVCDKNVGGRAAYTQFIVESSMTGMKMTMAASKVVTAEIMAHEVGHQLGMDHDFIGQDSTNVRKGSDGKPCSGFMDYNENTDKWSLCSNEDMKKFLNKQKKICLLPQGTTGQSTHWEEALPDGISNDPNAGLTGGECKPPMCIAGP